MSDRRHTEVMTSRDVTQMMTPLRHIMMSLGHFPMPVRQNSKVKLNQANFVTRTYSDVTRTLFNTVRTKFENELETMKFRDDFEFTCH